MDDPAALYAEARRHLDAHAAGLRRQALLWGLGTVALLAFMLYFVFWDAWRTGELVMALLSALMPVIPLVYTVVLARQALRAGADAPILLRGTVTRKEVRSVGKGRVERLLFVDAETAHRLTPAGPGEPVPALLTQAVKPQLRASHELFGAVDEGQSVTLVVGPGRTAVAKLAPDEA